MYRTPALIALGVAAIAVIVRGAVTAGNLLDSSDPTYQAVPVAEPGAPSVGIDPLHRPALRPAPGSTGYGSRDGGRGRRESVPPGRCRCNRSPRPRPPAVPPRPTRSDVVTSPAMPTATFESAAARSWPAAMATRRPAGLGTGAPLHGDEGLQGPADSAEVTFRHNGDSYLIEVTCPGGRPVGMLTETHH
jgi:hypothetical protein